MDFLKPIEKCYSRVIKPNGVTKEYLVDLCKKLHISASGNKSALCDRLDKYYKPISAAKIAVSHVKVPKATVKVPKATVKAPKVAVKAPKAVKVLKAAVKAPKSPQVPKLLGQGTYGCVYSPPIPCKENNIKYNNNTDVSKLMQAHEADLEYSMFNKIELSKLDPTSSFSIRAQQSCTPASLSNINNCNISINTPKILIYKNGGPDLDNTLANMHRSDSLSILTNFKNIIHGIDVLNTNHKYHMDLKAGNILTGKNGKGPFKFIDFGLSQTKYEPAYIYNSDYFAWPIDTVFMTGNAYISTHVKKFMANYHIKHYIEPYYTSKGWWSEQYLKSTLINILNNPKIDGAYSISKIDVYSIGAILTLMLKNNNMSKYHKIILQILDDSNILNPDPSLRSTPKQLLAIYSRYF